MDNQIKKIIDDYNKIPIPDELDFVINKALKKRKTRRISYQWLSVVSAAALFLVIGVNINVNIANAFSSIPGMDNIVKVLTFREYKVDEQTYNADIKVPIITNLENKELESALNEKYLEENKKLYEAFQAEMESLKNAGEGHLGVDTGFEIKTDNDDIFAISRYVTNTVASSSTTVKHDTIDKKNQVLLSLPMLFKDDRYINIISENIKEQMRAQMKADEEQFYWVSTGDPIKDEDLFYQFESITKDQDFYINDKYQLVISFNKYDVAPGYMGNVEFVIPTDVIADVLVSRTYIR